MVLAGFRSEIADAVWKAVEQLVSVRVDGDTAFVHLPLFYPSGAAVTVHITLNRGTFRVSDWGCAFREIDMVGGEHLFARAAKKACLDGDLLTSGKHIYSTSDADDLAAVISDVATASHNIAHAVVDRVRIVGENDLLLNLNIRLRRLFGDNKVESEKPIIGFSTNPWNVSALVHLEDHDAVFDVVSNHHTSVFTCSTKFNDLKLLENPPKTIAVVRNKEAMGAYYNILAQAGFVVQDNAPDRALFKAAA